MSERMTLFRAYELEVQRLKTECEVRQRYGDRMKDERNALLAALDDLLDWADHATGCELRRNPDGSCDCPIGRAHAAITNTKSQS